MIRPDASYTIVPRTTRPQAVQTILESREDLYTFRTHYAPFRPLRNPTYTWSSLNTIWFQWLTSDLVRVSWTPFIEWSYLEDVEFSPLERMAACLLATGKVSEDYVNDLFAQVATYEDSETQLMSEYWGKELVICGGHLYVSRNFEEALSKAQSEFPGRPYYAVSLKSTPNVM